MMVKNSVACRLLATFLRTLEAISFSNSFCVSWVVYRSVFFFSQSWHYKHVYKHAQYTHIENKLIVMYLGVVFTAQCKQLIEIPILFVVMPSDTTALPSKEPQTGHHF